MVWKRKVFVDNSFCMCSYLMYVLWGTSRLIPRTNLMMQKCANDLIWHCYFLSDNNLWPHMRLPGWWCVETAILMQGELKPPTKTVKLYPDGPYEIIPWESTNEEHSDRIFKTMAFQTLILFTGIQFYQALICLRRHIGSQAQVQWSSVYILLRVFFKNTGA